MQFAVEAHKREMLTEPDADAPVDRRAKAAAASALNDATLPPSRTKD